MSVGIYIEKAFVGKWNLTTYYHRLNVSTPKKSSISMRFNCGRNPDFS